MSAASGGQVVLWPRFTFVAFAYGLGMWLNVYLDVLFGNWPYPYNLGPTRKPVLGVAVPLAAGSGARNLVASVFWLLMLTLLVAVLAAGLFRPPPQRGVPGWVENLVLLVTALLLGTGWPLAKFAARDWRVLF